MGKSVNRTLEIAAIGKDASGIGHVAGPVVSFRGKGDPLRSLNVNIDPVQAGTGDPSPDNVRPISGWSEVNVWRTGKNVWKPFGGSYHGIDFVVQSDGTIKASGTADSTGYVQVANDVSLALSGLKTGDSITILSSQIGMCAIRFVKTDGTYTQITSINGTAATETIPDSTVTLRLLEYASASSVPQGTTVDVTLTFQLELGSTATPYEPYNGNQYTFQLGQTVYGGTLDVTNGVLTVDRAMVDMGTLNWSKNTTYPGLFNGYSLMSATKVPTPRHICSIYIATDSTTVISLNNSIAISGGGTTVYVHDDSYETATTFKAAMSGVQLVYELDTPITYQLTPTEIITLLGQNNIWADTGDVDAEYSASGGPGGKLAILLRERRELLIALKMGMTQEEAGLLGSLPGVSLGGGLSPGIIRPGASAQDEDEEEEIL